jgi:adenylate cyclase
MTTILIVDDELENLRSVARALSTSRPEWTVVTAQDEAEAFNAIANTDIDVVITDLVMRDEKSGMRVLQAATKKDPLVVVILITAFERKLDRYAAFDLGAFDCVQKNTPGVRTIDEILIKASSGARFRDLISDQARSRARLAFLQRYFDPSVYQAIEDRPDLLDARVVTSTVCFWDVRGFSRACEILKAKPTLISAFLERYFDAAVRAIHRNGGVVDKFIGDGVMGLFGTLIPAADQGTTDALNAVQAALDLRSTFANVRAAALDAWRYEVPQQVEIALGCGMHTGDVLVGNLGSGSRDQYTAVGPHVNFAQRIEARASGGQILLSGTTERRVGDRFHVQQIATWSDVKNIAGEFPIFELLDQQES